MAIFPSTIETLGISRTSRKNKSSEQSMCKRLTHMLEWTIDGICLDGGSPPIEAQIETPMIRNIFLEPLHRIDLTICQVWKLNADHPRIGLQRLKIGCFRDIVPRMQNLRRSVSGDEIFLRHNIELVRK